VFLLDDHEIVHPATLSTSLPAAWLAGGGPNVPSEDAEMTEHLYPDSVTLALGKPATDYALNRRGA
jgi:hypothetical protein